jgi:hypothetical protein
MAHYSFHKDLKQSQVAVEAVKKFFESKKNWKTEVIGKEGQVHGDINVFAPDGSKFDVEVKFDIKSEETGNLCFEVYNSKGVPTGILRTLAAEIDYVTVRKGKYVLFRFNAESLRRTIYDPKNWEMSRLVAGGDRTSYKMLLLKEDDAKKLAFEVVEIGNA